MAELLGIYTDKITQAGVVRRVWWYGLFQNDEGEKEWHYFGTDPADKPPPVHKDAPVFEHAYVQFPEDMNHLPADEVEDILMDLGVRMGSIREGLIE